MFGSLYFHQHNIFKINLGSNMLDMKSTCVASDHTCLSDILKTVLFTDKTSIRRLEDALKVSVLAG